MAESGGGSERKEPGQRMSKAALALGAAGLFLFIVGVKRKHRLDAEREVGMERRRRAAEE